MQPAPDLSRAAERELVVRSQRGEREAFRALYQAHAPGLLRFLSRLLGETPAAEDALQETFLRVHGALASVDPERPLRPYALRIARNVGIAALRRRGKVATQGLPGDAPTERSGPAEDAARDEARHRVREALDALPAGLRAALLLRHDQGLTVRAVGEALGVSERTARDRLREASVRLARELRARGLSEGGAA